jgi:hypothetical protein
MTRERLMVAVGLVLCVLFWITGEAILGLLGFLILVTGPWLDVDNEEPSSTRSISGPSRNVPP